MDIHKAGGGIHFTVRHSREASEEKLYESLLERLKNFQKAGNFQKNTFLLLAHVYL